MSRFIENLNAYVSAKKIKNNYISLKANIDPSKLSRIITGKQPVTEAEMVVISEALGHDFTYFLQEDFSVKGLHEENFVGNIALCYAGDPSELQKKTAEKLVEFAENIDNILSIKAAFNDIAGEGNYESF